MQKLKIIKKSSQFIKKNNIYYDSSLNYLDSLEPVAGFGIIQYWINGIKKIPYSFFLILKDFLLSFFKIDFVTINKLQKI